MQASARVIFFFPPCTFLTRSSSVTKDELNEVNCGVPCPALGYCWVPCTVLLSNSSIRGAVFYLFLRLEFHSHGPTLSPSLARPWRRSDCCAEEGSIEGDGRQGGAVTCGCRSAFYNLIATCGQSARQAYNVKHAFCIFLRSLCRGEKNDRPFGCANHRILC